MEVRALTGADGEAILAWRYPGRYSTYDFDDPSALDSDIWAVTEGGELIGYCCFGAPARVPGAEEEPGVLDLGYGLATILDYALGRHGPERVRLFVLDWNERSRRVAEGHGFAVESTLESDEGRFLVMARRGTGAPSV
jgi:ribosomal-protein-alanine N-acetyltransferase